jgi:hypothetical protein
VCPTLFNVQIDFGIILIPSHCDLLKLLRNKDVLPRKKGEKIWTEWWKVRNKEDNARRVTYKLSATNTLRILLEELDSTKLIRILDLGCGTADIDILLAKELLVLAKIGENPVIAQDDAYHHIAERTGL